MIVFRQDRFEGMIMTGRELAFALLSEFVGDEMIFVVCKECGKDLEFELDQHKVQIKVELCEDCLEGSIEKHEEEKGE